MARRRNDMGINKPRWPKSGECRVCHCTDEFGCDAGCSWVDRAHTLCSLCTSTTADLHYTLWAIGYASRHYPQEAAFKWIVREARAARRRHDGYMKAIGIA